jgi:Sec-independent protein translocase protein TatA
MDIRFISFIISVLMLYACSGGKIEKIPLEIPQELQSDQQATALITEMTDAVNDCRAATVKIARVAVESELGSPSLTQSLKMGAISIGFAKAQEKMANCIRLAEDMAGSLTEAQHGKLMACLKDLESRSVEIDNPKDLGMTPEEFERFKKENIALSNMPNEEVNYNDTDSLDEYRGEASGFMDDGFNKGEAIEMPRFMHILFPVLVIGLMVFFGIRRIKKFFGKTKEIGYTISNTKSKINEVKEKMEQEGDKDSPEYQNAKKALDFLGKFTGNNTNHLKSN